LRNDMPKNQLMGSSFRNRLAERTGPKKMVSRLSRKDFKISAERYKKRIIVSSLDGLKLNCFNFQVSGGAGFVGSHLVDRLMHQGHFVTVLDNFFTGDRQNIEHWNGHPHFAFIQHDVSNPIYLEADEVYHLASPASPPNYMTNPIKTLKANLLGSINLLGLARRAGATFLLASSSEVYGDPTMHPQSETYWGNVNPTGIRSCYDEGKRAAESLAYAYFRRENVPVRVARIFNTYGPRMQFHDGRVVSNFILQALSGQDICLYGDGSFTRSFMYVSDLVDGLIRLMNSNITDPVNLGNPHEFTIRELASIVKNLTESSSKIVNCPEALDDPKRRKPNIAKAKNLLHWEPKVQLWEGLRLTIKAFRESLHNNSILHRPEQPHLHGNQFN
uniref:UDP-glucuronic acid decarboxylase 1 n=1 Tax=Hydatigena taeniaeformis TaxID=6205 RepID=A0A0R3X669_HYDTA